MKFKILFILFFGITNMQAQVAKKPITPVKTAPKISTVIEGIFATFTTTKGEIVIQLEYQKTPVTVANFITLIEGKNTFVTNELLKGKPFYDGLKFHRVINYFMIQGGDPQGNGSGGPGYGFKDEIVSDLIHNKGGILSMANSGPGTNGSQFFITHNQTRHLDGKHTVFGHVTKGMDVVNKIVVGDAIIKATITRKGALAKKFDAPKTLANYFANKAEADKNQLVTNQTNIKKQIEIQDKLPAEVKKKQAEEQNQIQAKMQAEARQIQEKAQAEVKKNYVLQYGTVMADKVASLAKTKATATKTATGLEYALVKGTGIKPAEGTTVYVHYAGYLEDGSLFDSSREEITKSYGKFDANRATQNGYLPFPFQIGNKTGLIAGFLEGVNLMSFGDKMTLFIPANLGYGTRGAGNVIPPNATIIFEVELFEKQTIEAKQ